MRTIIIGLGNPVRSDDAVGLVVARLLRERLVDAGAADIQVTELPAGGLRLVEAMVGYDRAIVIDAMATGTRPPGSVRRLDLDELGQGHNLTCVHDTSLSTALAVWQGSDVAVPDDIAVWGIEGADLFTVGEDLSPPVDAAVPVAAQAILSELGLSPRRAT